MWNWVNSRQKLERLYTKESTGGVFSGSFDGVIQEFVHSIRLIIPVLLKLAFCPYF